LSPAADKTFSAAPLPMAGGRTGYVYIILRGMRFDSAADMIRNSYILRTAAANLAVTFGFTGLAGLLLFAFLTRRFRAVTQTVDAFAEGRLSERIALDSDDELGRLAQTINRMAASLQAHMQELHHRDAMRREFVANISHDLQSPVTSIQGYVETAMLKNAVLTEAERLQYLQIVREETERLRRLVEALLELARLDVAQPRPALERAPRRPSSSTWPCARPCRTTCRWPARTSG
jgi:signal transduction histidine kinase